MTVEELLEALTPYDKALPVMIHLGDTLNSADNSIKIHGIVPYCQFKREFVCELLDDGSPQKKCAECFHSREGFCKVSEAGVGENMIEVLKILGDWDSHIPGSPTRDDYKKFVEVRAT